MEEPAEPIAEAGIGALGQEDEEQAEDVEREFDDRLVWLLQRGGRKVLANLELQAQSLSRSRRQLQRRLYALAEGCFQTQMRLETAVLQYARMMHAAQRCHPLLYLRHFKHDETPIKLRCDFQRDGTVAETTKITAIEIRYVVVLEFLEDGGPQYLLLHGCHGVSLRGAGSATGESIAKTLGSCPMPEAALLQPFCHKWRVAETDMCTANGRAEAIIAKQPSAFDASLHGVCAAHCCHHIPTKSWDLLPGLLPSLIKTLLVLQAPGAFAQFEKAVLDEVQERFTVVHGHILSEEAQSHRQNVLKCYSPRPARRKAHATIRVLAELLFNGDWRGRPISHHCTACCDTPESSRASALAWVPRLLRSLRFKMFSRADWAQWQDALAIMGFLSGMHRLFAAAFLRAFSADAAASEPNVSFIGSIEDDTDKDAAAKFRMELSRNVRAAVGFWRTRPEWMLQALAVFLGEQRQAMADILHMTSVAWEHAECRRLRNTG